MLADTMLSDPVDPALFIAHPRRLREADPARPLLGEAYRRTAPGDDARTQVEVSLSAVRPDGARLRTA